MIMNCKNVLLLLFGILVMSCHSTHNKKNSINEVINQEEKNDSLPLGIKFREKCEQMAQDTLLSGVKHYSYDIHCYDSCFYSLTVDINMQYPEMPDNSYASYENNNGLRRFYSCQLCDWVKSITGKKPNVYIPKTFTWSADSLANYYSIKLSKIAEKQLKSDHHDEAMHFHNGIAGSSSISMFEVFRNEKYATICVYEYYGLSSMYHYFYKYSYYTVEVNNAGAISLGFNRIFKKEFANSVLELLAKGLVDARFGLGKQFEDYNRDFLELKTDQVALLPEGVIFYYAPYEQGCFAEGQINVILPYEQVEQFLESEILNQRF